MSDPFERLRAGLASRPEPKGGLARAPRGQRQAAVLMLFSNDPDPRLSFIERAAGLRRHAGQVAFPGGAMEDSDCNPTQTALREANEEVALQSQLVSVLGELPPAWIAVSQYDVTPVIASWDGSAELTVADPSEVAQVFSYPVSQLADPVHRFTATHPSGYRGPAFLIDQWFIWGFTAHLIDWVLELAGWQRPWDSDRLVAIPARFLRY